MFATSEVHKVNFGAFYSRPTCLTFVLTRMKKRANKAAKHIHARSEEPVEKTSPAQLQKMVASKIEELEAQTKLENELCKDIGQ